jgi:long-chain acyl-CoA synthetase
VAGIGVYARQARDATAIVFGRSSISFAELERRSQLLAGALAEGGLRRGDRIAVFAGNRPETLEVTTAALRAGIVPVPINRLLTSREVSYLLEDSGARWLFTDRRFEWPAVERIVTFGDAYERCLHDADERPIDDVVLTRPMHYTSGTTGTPKGVWVPPAPKDLAAQASQQFIKMWGLTDEDVHLVCSPLAHSAPMRFAIRTLEAGGTVVLQPSFDAAETLAAIELYGITSAFMVPTHLERITMIESGRHDVSSVSLLVHAGAPIRRETKEKVIEAFPDGSVWEFYGATEGQATRISTEEWRHKPGSVGTPMSGISVTITSSSGESLGPGEVGEVWIRGVERFEYWKDRQATRAAWRGDAFSVGDIGYLDRDGYLYLLGRTHETIITGGVNVYPQEIENVLVGHPAVVEAAVYGEPHPEWGQEVRALVVPAPEQPLDREILRRWARERLAGFKCPRRIDVVPELPRTPTGKVVRRPPEPESKDRS